MSAVPRSWTAALFAILLVAYGWLFVFFPKINNPNELVRLYMARAIAEHGTYAIGQRVQLEAGRFFDRGPIYSEWGYINDKALVCTDPRARPPDCAGTLYAAKAPGTSFLAAPIVAVVRAVVHSDAHREPTKTEFVFALRWLLGILPSIALWLAVRLFLLRSGVGPSVAVVAALAGGCGSLSLTYGQMAAGHQLGSVALGLAFLAAFWPSGDASLEAQFRTTSLIRKPGKQETATNLLASWVPYEVQLRATLVGLGAGAAICLEYPCAPAAALIGLGWILFRRPSWRAVGFAILGSLPPLLLLAHFHTVAFGAPWHTAYSHLENAGFVRDLAPGFMGISLPSWERVTGSLISPYLGLFYWAPWIALAIPAMFLLGKGALSAHRLHSVVAPVSVQNHGGSPPDMQPGFAAGLTASAVIAYYLVFQVTQALWRSGWTVGPRYITPIVPFAAIAIALAFQCLSEGARPIALAVFGGAAAAGIGATGLASAVCQGFPLEVYNPLVEVVWPLLSHGYIPRNALQLIGMPGLWSGLPYFFALGSAVVFCLLATRMALVRDRRGWLVIGSVALFAALTVAQWTATAGDASAQMGAVRALAGAWEPDPPPGARPFGN